MKVKYTDPANAHHITKIIDTGWIPVDRDLDSVGKADLLKRAIDDALGDAKNQVGGQPLAETTQGGDVVLVTPSSDISGTPGEEGTGATGIEIDSLRVRDRKTRENDVVDDPDSNGASDVSGVALVGVTGDLTGMDSDGLPSVVDVMTPLGTASVTLSGSETKREVAEELLRQLRSFGVRAVFDDDRSTLVVILDDSAGSIGAGSSDVGLETSVTVITMLD